MKTPWIVRFQDKTLHNPWNNIKVKINCNYIQSILVHRKSRGWLINQSPRELCQMIYFRFHPFFFLLFNLYEVTMIYILYVLLLTIVKGSPIAVKQQTGYWKKKKIKKKIYIKHKSEHKSEIKDWIEWEKRTQRLITFNSCHIETVCLCLKAFCPFRNYLNELYYDEQTGKNHLSIPFCKKFFSALFFFLYFTFQIREKKKHPSSSCISSNSVAYRISIKILWKIKIKKK